MILKRSTAKGNPDVVKQLDNRFPGRIFSDITRAELKNPEYAISLIKQVTKGRPFAILEYGAYFAPAASAIANDSDTGPRFLGIVEGTENGIQGSSDGCMPGYDYTIHNIKRPVISKSRSAIKKIMDLDIGPAIVRASNDILYNKYESVPNHHEQHVGVIGVGSIGRGVLKALTEINIKPYVYDTNLSVMAEMAHCKFPVVTQKHILEKSDIIYLNTGSCFLSHQPSLLNYLKDNALLILCTSGDVEAGIPQLIESGHLHLQSDGTNADIAVFKTRHGKPIRIMLGGDGVGHAPNMTLDDGSNSPVNMMSDMEFYALGAYLGSHQNKIPTRQISESPEFIQNIIIEEWLKAMHPEAIEQNALVLPAEPLASLESFRAGSLLAD